jgi:hypothetical protein
MRQKRFSLKQIYGLPIFTELDKDNVTETYLRISQIPKYVKRNRSKYKN